MVFEKNLDFNINSKTIHDYENRNKDIIFYTTYYTK